jgi:HAAS
MINGYVSAVGRHLHVSKQRRERILREVRAHLVDSTTELEARGLEPDTARRTAIAAFGPPEQFARECNAQAATSTMRRTPAVIGVAGVMVGAGFLAAAATVPRSAAPPPAGIGAQVMFFVTVIAFQCAIVAGARAASLVAASWRASVAPVDVRDIVRHAATVCVVGLGLATAAWLVTISIRAGDGRLLEEPRAVIGIALMIAGALGAAMFSVAHRAAMPESGVADLPFSSGVIVGAGERVVSLVLDHPIAACVTTAIVGAASAMRHAETTALGALPWGVAEAAAVVIGFVLLGPRLGLRRGLSVSS